MHLSKNAEFMHRTSVIFTSLLAFAYYFSCTLRMQSFYAALNTSSTTMHPLMQVNLAGAHVVKFGHAPAWEHWSSFTQGMKTGIFHLSMIDLKMTL